jgi:putative acetyltransferase
MSDGFRIRRATEADYALLTDIFRMSVRKIASRDYSPAQIAAWTSAEPDWNTRNALVFAAEKAGAPIGFAEYELPDSVGMTYVHPKHIRNGAGRALLSALEEEALRRGVTALNVEASITSRPFFQACGYSVVMPQMVHVRGEDFLNYRMTKSIR